MREWEDDWAGGGREERVKVEEGGIVEGVVLVVMVGVEKPSEEGGGEKMDEEVEGEEGREDVIDSTNDFRTT